MSTREIPSAVGRRKVWENTDGRGNETSADLCSKFPGVNTKQIIAHTVATVYGALHLICELCCTQEQAEKNEDIIPLQFFSNSKTNPT